MENFESKDFYIRNKNKFKKLSIISGVFARGIFGDGGGILRPER